MVERKSDKFDVTGSNPVSYKKRRVLKIIERSQLILAYIYKISNDINNKVYIGKTSHSTIEERFKEHIADSKKQHIEKRPLYKAMNKYGVEHFTIEQIEYCENDEIASIREQYWINFYKSFIGFEKCNGYNATLGGDSRRIYNYDEIVEIYLLKKSIKDTANFIGCDERTVSQACKEKGIKLFPKNSKAIRQFNLETNETINIFNSICEAAKLQKLNRNHISEVCNGKRNSYNGFGWEFIILRD